MTLKALSPATAIFLLLAFLPVWGQSQSAAPAPSETPVFHSQSKLVIVDVVVTGKGGQVQKGLKPADFQVFDAGKPQRIRFFEEHTSATQQAAQTLPQLPPNQYTNFPVSQPKDTTNIVLFDLLNTQATDQMNARKEMLKALEKLPKGRPMALFVLGERLHMVQGPTGSTDELVKAAKGILASSSFQVKDFQQTMSEQMLFNSIESQSGYGGYGTPADVAAELSHALFIERAAMTTNRVSETLGSLVALARMLSGFPGRKNLIWISSGVPFRIGPNTKATERWRQFTDKAEFAIPLETAATLLADSQVSIYPVDVSGLAVLGVSANITGTGFSPTGSTYAGALADQTDSEWDNRTAMRDIAEQTGGHTYFGSNDLAKAITDGIDRGARYYTIAYSPSDFRADGAYHAIEIKTSKSGLDLQYRKGYIAIRDNIPNSQDAVRALSSSMQLGMPQSTALLMRVQVLPPSKDHPASSVDYAIAPDDVQFNVTPDRVRRATVDFLGVAFDGQGKPVETKSTSIDTNIRPGTSADALKTGIPGHLELNLAPGKYILCLGAMDRNSQKIGTIWTTITVPAGVAPVAAK